MSFLLDGMVSEYPSWRNYFDLVITGAMKPAFFTEGRPFVEIESTTGTTRWSARRRRSSGGRCTRAGTCLRWSA
jgi:hypothetical protein